MKNSYKAEEWQQLIAKYRSSGLSAKLWCEQKQISVHKLRYHITKLNKEKIIKKQSSKEAKHQWVSLPLEQPSISSPPIILKAGRITIELSAGFDKNVLLDVLSVVESYD